MSQPSMSSCVPRVHLRDVDDKAGAFQPAPSLAQRKFSLLLTVVHVVIIVVIITSIIAISITIRTIIRTAATEGAGLARWRALSQAAG